MCLEPLLTYLLAEFKHPLALVANGQFPARAELLERLKASTHIIACDGAIHNLQQQQIIADFLIGDNDSSQLSPAQHSSWVKNPYHHDGDQDTNDLTKAIKFISANYPPATAIIIYAATGLREDHTLANIALLAQYAQMLPLIAMVSDFGLFRVCLPGTTYLPCWRGQQISFFSPYMTDDDRISCPELKWPLQQHHLPYLNSGTLNQATTTRLSISTTAPAIVYQAFEIKSA